MTKNNENAIIKYIGKKGEVIMEKEVIQDEFGRKIQTTHFTKNGNVDYINSYYYQNADAKVPEGGMQVYYSEDGKKEQDTQFVYDEEKGRFRIEKKRFYNTDGNIVMSISFNENEEIEKQKRFSYKNGFTFVHREEFEKGHLIKSGNYVALAGTLLDMQDERVRSIVENYKCISGEAKKEDEKKKETKKPSIFAALKKRLSR